MKHKLLVLSLMCAAAQGGTVFDNGAPNLAGTRDISLFRSADDFVLAGSANIAAIRFWISSTSPVVNNPQDNFSGNITYAIYNNSAGSIGSLISTGTVSGLVSTFSGQTYSGSNANVNVLDFDLTSVVNLGAGTYWLELHEGTTLGTSDSSNIGWELTATSGNAKQGFAVNGVPTGSVNNEFAFQLFDTPFNASAVPEPGSLLLAGAGLAAVLLRKRF